MVKRRPIRNPKILLMFIRSSIGISPIDIEQLEESIECQLPDDFKRHYLSNNGGIPNRTFFYVEKDDGFVEVSFFLPIKYKSNNIGEMTIEESHKNLILKGLPANYLPFALDWGGNYFSIEVNTNDIVLLLTDLGEFSNASIKYLTTGFVNFINGLELEGDEI